MMFTSPGIIASDAAVVVAFTVMRTPQAQAQGAAPVIAPAPAQARELSRDALHQQLEMQREAIRVQMDVQREAIRAQVNAQREAMEAQREAANAARVAQGTTVQPFPHFPTDPMVLGPPEGVVIIAVVFLVACALTIVGLPLARAFARRMDRKGAVAPERPDVSARLERIEQAVEAVAIEVERISESQRFANQVMSEIRALPRERAGAVEPASIRQGSDR